MGDMLCIQRCRMTFLVTSLCIFEYVYQLCKSKEQKELQIFLSKTMHYW